VISSMIDKTQVRHHFSDHAGEYDLYARVQKRVACRLLELVPPDIVEGPMLDIGTGTGEVACRYLDNGADRPVVVSDIAHEMTMASRANTGSGLAIDGDAQALPFRDETFGLVLSSSVFQWVEDLDSAFDECRRILKPGGVFAFALFCDGTLHELGNVFRQALKTCRSDWPDHFQRFPVPDEVRSTLGNARFHTEACRVEIETEYHPTLRDLMVGLKKIGAQNASSKRPVGFFPRRVLQEMNRQYREMYADARGLPASYGVFYGIAQKVR